MAFLPCTVAVMNNECGAQYVDATALKHTCNLVRNHEGPHYDYRYRRTWPRFHPFGGHFKVDWGTSDSRYKAKVTGEFPKETSQYADWFTQEYKTGVLGEWQEQTVTLELTLTDLKTIAYYMAEEEDADKTKIKIDNALKEML